MRGDEIQHNRATTLGQWTLHRPDRLGVDRWAIDGKRFAESPHPFVVLIELLAAGECAPGDQLVHIGVAGIIADMLALKVTPGRGGNDLGWLCPDIAEGGFVVLPGPG